MLLFWGVILLYYGTCQRTSGCDASNYNRQTRECQLIDGGAACDCNVEVDPSLIHIRKMSLYSDYIIDCKTRYNVIQEQYNQQNIVVYFFRCN